MAEGTARLEKRGLDSFYKKRKKDVFKKAKDAALKVQRKPKFGSDLEKALNSKKGVFNRKSNMIQKAYKKDGEAARNLGSIGTKRN